MPLAPATVYGTRSRNGNVMDDHQQRYAGPSALGFVAIRHLGLRPRLVYRALSALGRSGATYLGLRPRLVYAGPSALKTRPPDLPELRPYTSSRIPSAPGGFMKLNKLALVILF